MDDLHGSRSDNPSGQQSGAVRLHDANHIAHLTGSTADAIESRRKLYAALVTVGALRALLSGKDEDGAAADVRAWGAKLAAAGGAPEEKRFGPRVEKVFAKLK